MPGLEDRPCAPLRRARIPAKVEDRIVYLLRSRRWGLDRIAAYMGQSSSTVHRELVRRGTNRLDRLIARPAGGSAATSTPVPARWSMWT